MADRWSLSNHAALKYAGTCRGHSSLLGIVLVAVRTAMGRKIADKAMQVVEWKNQKVDTHMNIKHTELLKPAWVLSQLKKMTRTEFCSEYDIPYGCLSNFLKKYPEEKKSIKLVRLSWTTKEKGVPG